MCAGDEVIVPQGGDSSHSHRFLPRVKVGRPLNQVAPQQFVDFVLECSDLPHLPQEIQSLLFAEPEFFQVDPIAHDILPQV